MPEFNHVQPNHCVGKVVARVVEEDSRLGIVFSDNSYIYVTIDHGYDGESDLDYGEGIDNEGKVKMGMMEQSELDRITQERQNNYKASILVRERTEYERLKAKFEKS